MIHGPMAGAFEKKRLEMLVSRWVDAYASVPLRFTAACWSHAGSTVADRVSLEFDRVSAAITNTVAFFLLKRVMSL